MASGKAKSVRQSTEDDVLATAHDRTVALHREGAMTEGDIGVWGNQNASRLRRLLRAHDSQLVVERRLPENVRRRVWTTIG
jgi:hypothetical protein